MVRRGPWAKRAADNRVIYMFDNLVARSGINNSGETRGGLGLHIASENVQSEPMGTMTFRIGSVTCREPDCSFK